MYIEKPSFNSCEAKYKWLVETNGCYGIGYYCSHCGKQINYKDAELVDTKIDHWQYGPDYYLELKCPHCHKNMIV